MKEKIDKCHNIFFHQCSPSFSNMENLQRNLDIQELQYNPSKKDLTDARIHHLLAEELKPYRRVKLHHSLDIIISISFQIFLSQSYYSRFSRHTVDDRDLSTQVNYKMRMHIRRMAQGDRKHHHKRGKKMNKVNKTQILGFNHNITFFSYVKPETLGKFKQESRIVPRFPTKWFNETLCERYEMMNIDARIFNLI